MFISKKLFQGRGIETIVCGDSNKHIELHIEFYIAKNEELKEKLTYKVISKEDLKFKTRSFDKALDEYNNI